MKITRPLFGGNVTIASYQENPDISQQAVLINTYQQGLLEALRANGVSKRRIHEEAFDLL